MYRLQNVKLTETFILSALQVLDSKKDFIKNKRLIKVSSLFCNVKWVDSKTTAKTFSSTKNSILLLK